MIRAEARRMMAHFISDNTSPETHSFYTPTLQSGARMGDAIAKETAKRLLLSHLLVMYANRRFHLLKRGQRLNRRCKARAGGNASLPERPRPAAA
jgi:hypothetical protein